MIAGMIISAGNKKIISEEKYKAFSLPTSIDPLTRQQDNPAENINLIRQVPTRMGDYMVTYLNDSSGHETGRNFYHLQFEKKAPGSTAVTETFVLSPDVYLMKNNSMSSNPDTRSYLTHDVFTYISYVLNPERTADTSAFNIREVKQGDTVFYSNGYMIFNGTVKNPASNKFNIRPGNLSVLADLTVVTKDSARYNATPMLYIDKVELPEIAGRPAGLDSMRIVQVDDTVYAQNLHIRFAGVATDQQKIQIAWRETDAVTDFVTLKAYIFPYINFVWIGLILLSVGFVISMGARARLSTTLSLVLVTITALAMIYMFLFASN
jgi:cytochrome c-type biogenesis protein CcmF